MENLLTYAQLEILKESVIAIFLMLVISISARFMLSALGQNWVRTFSHTATLTILPIITFVITNVISGNIALSLGMVGALSIVRFRNPVKSPFELAIYFGSITLGITASVSLAWLMVFVVAIALALLTLFILDKSSSKFIGRPMFEASFSEGNQMATIEVVSRKEYQHYLESDFLISHSKKGDEFIYILGSNNKAELVEICNELTDNEDIIHYQLNT